MIKVKRILALILSLAVFCSMCVMLVGCVNEEEIKQKQQHIDELQAQLASKQQEIDDLQAQLESKQKEVDDSKRENETSTYELNNAKKDIKTLVGQLSQLIEQDLETLSEYDEEVMKSYREPSLKENFEDNAVSVIFKSRFVGLVGFDDFAVTKSVSEVIAIKHKSETIYKGSNEKFPIYQEYNQGLTLTLSTHDKEKVLEVAEILRKLDMVLIARPDYIRTVTPSSVPSDTNYSAQWGLKGDYGINVEGAWDYTQGDYSVKVGVMEGYFDGHEDLNVNNVNANLIYPSIDDRIKQPLINHGTHVAGIIGANMDNNRGIAGIAKCSINMLNPGNLKASLEYAANNGIRIINASFYYTTTDVNGATIPDSFDEDDYEAIKKYNGLLICSAGNDSNNNDYYPVYPASYNLPNVISVGSIDEDGTKSSFSNYGKSSVDIFAPGEGILSTFPQSCTGVIVQAIDGREYYECETKWIEYPEGSDIWYRMSNDSTHYAIGYHYMSGTSMAAPHVTGVAALLLSKNPDLTPEDIKATILGNVDKSDALSNLCVSGGRLNANNVLRNTIHCYSYESIGDGKHRAVCACGSQRVEYHTGLFRNTGLFSGHKGVCKICGFDGEELHVWQYETDISVCAVCKVKSQRVPVIMSLMSSEFIQTLDNANLKNGETYNIGNMVVLYDQGQYFLLVEVNDYKSDLESKLKWQLRNLT